MTVEVAQQQKVRGAHRATDQPGMWVRLATALVRLVKR